MTDPAPQPEATASTEAPAIRVRHLWHRYGGMEVLRDVSFEVARGEIFGFIGPNGAGKTTTIRVMATLLEPMAGRVEIEGIDVAVDPDRVRRRVGYMPDHAGVYDRITVREYLEFFADSYRVANIGVVDAVIELTDLLSLQDRLVAALSKGMKQRLGLARILLHDPSVLILDEPASDLDPRARIEMRDLLLELRELGKTVLLSSHILTELSDVCTSVGILERGRLLVAGPIGEIAQRLDERRRTESTGQASPEPPRPARWEPGSEPTAAEAAAAAAQAASSVTAGGTAVPAAARRRLKLRVLGDSRAVLPLIAGGAGVLGVEPGPAGQLTVWYTGDERFVADVVRHLVASGVGVVAVEPERNELERIFLEVTKGELQ
jgi:ABC-2 type transport system ATP-binding protein